MLLMHGEPSWSYLYRKMIPLLIRAGHRTIAPDLVGFGRSDKPARADDYTYERQVNWMLNWLDKLNLQQITFFGQDWGGLIGLRLVAARPELFARVVVANTGLPTGDGKLSKAFLVWRQYSIEVPEFDVGKIIAGGCTSQLPPGVIDAYNAPFPDDSFKAGARILPSLVPATPDDPSSVANRQAWEILSRFEKPFLTAFSDRDPVTKGGERLFQRKIPGARDLPHTTIKDGGHFLQEDCGEELAKVIIDFIA